MQIEGMSKYGEEVKQKGERGECVEVILEREWRRSVDGTRKRTENKDKRWKIKGRVGGEIRDKIE